MRAEPRRKNHTMGAKWLRQGGIIPVSLVGMNDGEPQRKEGNGDHGTDNHTPIKLGISANNNGVGQSDMTGGNKGGDYSEVVTTVMPKNPHFLNDRREDNISDFEQIGLSITDPKRRRLDEPILERPNNNLNAKDDIMIESQEGNSQDSKNLLLAGAAMQTRQTS
ncbi:hypothetical protein POM88_041965 [Heracleum sosnowskyi]|uniref:Uncharacterized protein n=1 Tax=Heracleum sosnowskyi TaxID=360622 RepID=A0AAD8HHD8_9APIA|nr:hypothetical protein POM88_041965 [Heracleum sosnowskyi]